MTKKPNAIRVEKLSCIYCRKNFTDECDSDVCLETGVSKYFGPRLMPFNFNYSLFEPKEVKDDESKSE